MEHITFENALLIGSLLLVAGILIGKTGYRTVYICGIVIGNARFPNRRAISKFIDGMTWLAQIVVFLMLGLLVNPHEMVDVADKQS